MKFKKTREDKLENININIMMPNWDEYTEIFEKDNKMVIVTKTRGETRKNFLLRGQFIVNNLGKCSVQKLVDKSHIFVNIMVNKNTYDSHIMKKFKDEFNVNLV